MRSLKECFNNIINNLNIRAVKLTNQGSIKANEKLCFIVLTKDKISKEIQWECAEVSSIFVSIICHENCKSHFQGSVHSWKMIIYMYQYNVLLKKLFVKHYIQLNKSIRNTRDF